MGRKLTFGALVIIGVGGLFAFSYFQERIFLNSADVTDPSMVALGQSVYKDQCSECHGINLEGKPNWRVRNADGILPAPPHDETGHTWHHGDELLFNYTKGGGQKIAGPGFTSGMPPFEDVLSDKEIWAALAFIKSHWPEQILNRQQAMSTRR